MIMRKRKVPKFRRQGISEKAVGPEWRKPRGINSKQKVAKRGKPVMVKIGYKNPAALRGKTSSGFSIVLVNNLAQLDGINPQAERALISGRVGRLKRMQLLERADSRKIHVINR